MRCAVWLFVVGFALLGSVGSVLAGDKPVVFVSIVPQKSFVEWVAGDLVRVEVMVQPGASPHTYEPKPSQMRMLQQSIGYFSIGVPFEQAWLAKLAALNPRMRLFATDLGIEKIVMADHHDDHGHVESPDHQHGAVDSEVSDSDGGYDPHIWLSPRLLPQQLLLIRDGLTSLFPDKADVFTDNAKKAIERVIALDRQLLQLLHEVHGMKFLVFHPSWGYFARDYGLVESPIQIEGKDPKPAQLLAIVREAREKDIHLLFVQPQFSRKNADLIAREIGGRVVEADPLAADWHDNLLRVGHLIREGAK